jgi:hypothetical protein
MYSSLCDEVARAREAIADVKELLERRKDELGEEGVRSEWEVEVDGLVERSEGWRCVFSYLSSPRKSKQELTYVLFLAVADVVSLPSSP